jgi:Cys-rich four helix bundle protein (predicted Tat secretion target)
MLGAIGAIAMAGIATPVAAQQHDHQHHHGHAANKFSALAAAAGDCVVKGDACLAHCLTLLGDGDKVMAICAKSVNQMLAICGAVQKLGAQDAAFTGKLVKLALEVWAECEKECRKHEKKHAECKACADACAECIKLGKGLAA